MKYNIFVFVMMIVITLNTDAMVKIMTMDKSKMNEEPILNPTLFKVSLARDLARGLPHEMSDNESLDQLQLKVQKLMQNNDF
jgi:hypothetical protein